MKTNTWKRIKLEFKDLRKQNFTDVTDFLSLFPHKAALTF